MTTTDDGRVDRLLLSTSQQNIYHGVLQEPDPALYLIGKSYRFRPMALSAFLPALRATILGNPIQLCVLAPAEAWDGYPALVPRLQCDDVIHIQESGGEEPQRLEDTWSAGILSTPLVRYTVHTDIDMRVVGMDVHTHHLLLDGGATAIIEAGLARHLESTGEESSAAINVDDLERAHRYERVKAEQSTERFGAAVQAELAEEVQCGATAGSAGDAIPGTAGRGVLQESLRVDGEAYDIIVALAEARQVPLNVLVSAAAVAVHASMRQSTQTLLVHPVDNRFGEPDLNVATCLVNSVVQPVRFPAFASVADVVAALDRGYVKAVRRRWFREERYRRMYLAINRSLPVEALTVNFMRGRCAVELGPYLSEPAVVTDIGPVEGMTVACVHDEDQHTLDFAIWNRIDAAGSTARSGAAERIVAALTSMATHWDDPIALTVGDWFGLAADGSLRAADAVPRPEPVAAQAWFLDAAVDQRQCRGPGVDRWVAEIVRVGAAPGDVLVFADDESQCAIELLVACHLAGCGYSVCATVDEVGARADTIGAQGDTAAYVIDVAATLPELDERLRALVEERIEHVTRDNQLATRPAYVMPTSGSTGEPKLVPVTHGSLAAFCAAARTAYGWGPADTVLQCAPLTSDISVEEVFVSVSSGARVVRSAAMRTGDLQALARDVAASIATVLDLPTAIWHLLCDDSAALAALSGSALRQVVVGGEAIRATAVAKWLDSPAVQGISLISTYGPTETTVVVTYLPVGAVARSLAPRTTARLGRPLVPGSVFVGFGEVVVVGELVSAGYVGMHNPSFGTVYDVGGQGHRAFVTADRVTRDVDGFPVFAGRRDAVVKIAGKRVDTADLMRRISSDPDVTDLAVEPAGAGLGIWFQTALTRAAADDPVVRTRIRAIARSLEVPSFAVDGVPAIPRKASGKVDRAKLIANKQLSPDRGDCDRAASLADIWGGLLGRSIGPGSSLLDEGIGSLELIRILPATREFLNWQLSVLDLISADTAANVVEHRPAGDTWMDGTTAAEIADDFVALTRPDRGAAPGARRLPIGSGAQPIVILGASGIVATGMARAIADLTRQGRRRPDVVFATRSPVPQHGPWTDLSSLAGVQVVRLPGGFGAADLGALLQGVGAGTVVNCIGNTNVLVPYRELRTANVDAVSHITEACVRHGARLVHLSTFVVNADVTAGQVTDPRFAPYPYAASKSLAELAVGHTPDELDFTVVRLPRVLGDVRQLERSSDILVSILDACTALGLCPIVPLVEEVTTSVAAAHGILGLLPALSPAVELGRGMTVLRGEKVHYTEFLGSFGFDAIDPVEWKDRLDRSAWAQRNPSRWAVIDAWIGLGARLRGRTYAEYLAEYPTVDIDFESLTETVSTPAPLRGVLAPDAVAVGN
ncbi:AMP-binding protein [Mycobacterium sp. PDNC021]|uniref:AMP-binding protein n=1 Tax=Mycobacterium sp. PDNC021 TaxID=3391399 RepID=UPI003AAF4988